MEELLWPQLDGNDDIFGSLAALACLFIRRLCPSKLNAGRNRRLEEIYHPRAESISSRLCPSESNAPGRDRLPAKRVEPIPPVKCSKRSTAESLSPSAGGSVTRNRMLEEIWAANE
jgi:hypothetical protein